MTACQDKIAKGPGTGFSKIPEGPYSDSSKISKNTMFTWNAIKLPHRSVHVEVTLVEKPLLKQKYSETLKI